MKECSFAALPRGVCPCPSWVVLQDCSDGDLYHSWLCCLSYSSSAQTLSGVQTRPFMVWRWNGPFSKYWTWGQVFSPAEEWKPASPKGWWAEGSIKCSKLFLCLLKLWLQVQSWWCSCILNWMCFEPLQFSRLRKSLLLFRPYAKTGMLKLFWLLSETLNLGLLKKKKSWIINRNNTWNIISVCEESIKYRNFTFEIELLK